MHVAAAAEAQAAASSKPYPSPSEVSLAQDILALASSALSSSTKLNDKDTSGHQNGNRIEEHEEKYRTDEDDGKPNWAYLLQDFQKIGTLITNIVVKASNDGS